MSRKTSEKGGKNRLCLSFNVFVEVSFDDFRLYHACFSSLTGAVLTFFAYFFASRQKE
jgi:hypothetical protein